MMGEFKVQSAKCKVQNDRTSSSAVSAVRREANCDCRLQITDYRLQNDQTSSFAVSGERVAVSGGGVAW
jgi:hypothetical protein